MKFKVSVVFAGQTSTNAKTAKQVRDTGPEFLRVK